MSKRIKEIFKSTLFFFFRDRSFLIINKIGYYKTKIKIAIKVRLYNKRKESIILEKSQKEKLCILFFVSDLTMWKYEGLMNLLLAHPKFYPIIVPFVIPDKDNVINKKNSDEIVKYCQINKYPIRIGYDFNKERYLDIADINPDIVVYTQPYDRGYRSWRIDNYIKNSLFVYTPYGISTSENQSLKDTYLTNIAWKIFVSCQLEKKVYEESISIAKGNVVVTGAEIFEKLQTPNQYKSPWRNNTKKRLIWAPHHSLDSKKGFSNSTFERICNEMLEISIKYQNRIEIAFKPHPVLYERLTEKWGLDKTEAYYKQWTTLPNTILCTGNYIELFAFSDAMIHDCASFSYEYLLMNKPVMFICKNEECKPPKGISNDLGKECFKYHYKGYSAIEIMRFIEERLLDGNDPLRSPREQFIRNELYPPFNKAVSENMMTELSEIFNR